MIEIWANSVRFSTSQRLADQARMIIRKGWFSNLEILEIYRQTNSEDSLTRSETLNTETKKKQNKLPNPITIQNSDERKVANPSITKQMFTQEDKINVELIKKIMIEHKTTLLFLRNQDWKKVKR